MKYIKDENDFSTMIAEVEISYSHKIKPSLQVKACSSSDVYKHVLALWKNIDYYESFAVLLLSRANKILGLHWISTGGISGVAVDPKRIFQAALKSCASSIILLHNHPSGQLIPSDADIKLTRKIKEGGKLLDIPVLDHMIITSEGYYSMADEGTL